MDKNKQRVKEIDTMRGIAIFLVILGHAIIVYPVNLHEISWCKTLHDLIYSFHMEFFFMISGWCFSPASKSQYRGYVIKKLKRLMIPYAIFSIADFVTRSMFGSFINRDGIDWKYILFYGGNYWFIYVLFLISLFYPLIGKIPYIWLQTIIVLLAFVISSGLPEILCLKFVCKYLLFFHIGYFIRIYNLIEMLNGTKDVYKAIALILFFISWIIIFFSMPVSEINSLIVPVLGSGMVILLASMLVIRSAIDWIRLYGTMTLPIYLLEGYWLTIARTITCKVLGITAPIVIIVVNVIFDFFISYAVSVFLCKRVSFVRFAFGM